MEGRGQCSAGDQAFCLFLVQGGGGCGGGGGGGEGESPLSGSGAAQAAAVAAAGAEKEEGRQREVGETERTERKRAAEEHNKGFETCVSGLSPLCTHV